MSIIRRSDSPPHKLGCIASKEAISDISSVSGTKSSGNSFSSRKVFFITSIAFFALGAIMVVFGGLGTFSSNMLYSQWLTHAFKAITYGDCSTLFIGGCAFSAAGIIGMGIFIYIFAQRTIATKKANDQMHDPSRLSNRINKFTIGQVCEETRAGSCAHDCQIIFSKSPENFADSLIETVYKARLSANEILSIIDVIDDHKITNNSWGKDHFEAHRITDKKISVEDVFAKKFKHGFWGLSKEKFPLLTQ